MALVVGHFSNMDYAILGYSGAKDPVFGHWIKGTRNDRRDNGWGKTTWTGGCHHENRVSRGPSNL